MKIYSDGSSDFDKDCIHVCITLSPTFHGICPHPDSCDWYCASKRLGCPEGLKYHCARDSKSSGIETFIEACGKEKVCQKGKTVYLLFQKKVEIIKL